MRMSAFSTLVAFAFATFSVTAFLQAELIDFNIGLPERPAGNFLEDSTYQPFSGLTVGFSNMHLYNGGPDHTTGIIGSNHYNACVVDNKTPAVLTFSKPVSISSLWLTNFSGSTAVTIKAFSDTAGSDLLGELSPTLKAGGYNWTEFTGLSTYGTKIQRLEFSNTTDFVQVDDITVSTVPEPSTTLLTLSGMISILAYAWRKRR